MKDELLKILEMVKNGTIEVNEAAELIEAFFDNDLAEEKSKKTKKKLIIKVLSENGEKVNIKLPLGLMKIAKAMIPFGLSQQNSNIPKEQIDQIIQAIENINFNEFDEENIIDINSENGDIVKIYIE